MKTVRHKITVKGGGSFPVDMLRYDCCWPASERDSYQIDLDWRFSKLDPREIELYADHGRSWTPTVGRWESFNWKVVSSKVVA